MGSALVAAGGRNALPEPVTVPVAARVARQLGDPMAILLVAAGVSGVVLGEVVDAIAIGAIVVLNATIAVVEEVRAASALRALRALRDLEVPHARVRRVGVVRRVDASELVLGDVVVLEAGARVPADLRLGAADGRPGRRVDVDG